MKECRIISIMLVTVLIFSELIFPLQGAAQEPLALGEIKASDGVKTESSNGKWIEMPKVYPLFKTTKLMTNNGVVFITTREGSRIDFSRETEVTIDAINASYSVNLVHGTVSFNMAPNSTLNIDTKDAHISVAPQVADYHSLVAGAGAPALKNVKGIVTSADATYIRSIAGKINVSGKTFQARVLDTGETFFASLVEMEL